MQYELALIIVLLVYVAAVLTAGRDRVGKVEVLNPGHAVSGVVRVLKQDGERWIPSHFVREGTPAYQQAMDTPGQAVQTSDGSVMLGKQ